MQIQIWSDIACPWCYVGKRRFEAALAQFEHRDGVEVTWRSFELDPAAPATQDEPQAVLLARKYGVSVEKAEAMNARMTEQAAGEGLEFHFERARVANTFDAHRLVHFARTRGLQDAMKERLFRAYLTEGRSLGDRETLVELAGVVGLDASETRAALDSGNFAQGVRADEARARALGITGVPFFVIDEKYGISGAQPADVILGALRQAWSESPMVVMGGDGGRCDDGSCEV